MNEQDIMEFEDVMEYLHVCKNTLYSLLRSQQIRAFQIGRIWKIPKASVDAYIETKMKNGTA